jgi:STE24 endopeptidase
MPAFPTALDSSLLLTFVFAFALALGLLAKLWLASRQIRYVAKHRHQVPSAFSGTITLSEHQRAADYTLAKARLSLIELAISAGILLGWTLLGGLSLLNAALMNTLGGGLIQQLALISGFVVINGLLELPLSWYQTFVLESRFGFNKTTPRLWLLDLVKSSLLGAAIGLPIAALILWVMDASGGLWWLWTWAVWMGFNLLLLLIYPSFIAPLFNKFTPLNDETLKSRVTALMARCGFSAEGLYVMDGSKRSAHANAYFTGFGASKRVVFYDTLLAKLSADEVDAVLAHELGHFKHNHVLKRIVAMFSMSLLGLALLGWLATQVWFFTGLGVFPNLDTSNSALSLLLFMLAIPVFSFFITPLFARLSRKHEFEADTYAVEKTNGPALASALLKLYQDNASTLTPDPVYVQFYYSHPPASERLARMAA